MYQSTNEQSVNGGFSLSNVKDDSRSDGALCKLCFRKEISFELRKSLCKLDRICNFEHLKIGFIWRRYPAYVTIKLPSYSRFRQEHKSQFCLLFCRNPSYISWTPYLYVCHLCQSHLVLSHFTGILCNMRLNDFITRHQT